tara:strand:+ start:6962 stop:8110 length:1149 start_codon:yes stop_codon:yes gene_type:complete
MKKKNSAKEKDRVKKKQLTKVGIMTFMLHNYGAVLQAYALQAYLKKQEGLDVCNIDFRTDWHDKDDKIFNLQGRFKTKLATFVYTLLRYPGLKKRKLCTSKFKKKYFSLTQRIHSEKELISKPPEMDIYVTGSDQVFNPNGLFPNVYFLNFSKGSGKKVAYAPSFGGCDFSNNFSKQIEPMISDFEKLSCREEEGADFLSKIVKTDVPVLVDPTFLLNAEEWSTVASPPNIKGKYIFIYDLAGDENLIQIANKIKDKTGYKIVCLSCNIRKFYNIEKHLYSCGPAEYLCLIKNAEYVVADSFHGAVFSIIFNKSFFVYVSPKKENVSSRIYNLAKLLNFNDRILTSEKVQNFSFSEEPFLLNKKELNKRISISQEFIKKHIQ